MNLFSQPRASVLFASPARGVCRWLLGILWLSSAAAAASATFTENFATDPLTRGWQIFGSTKLFHWDSTNQNLAVTWDSSQTNSYFHLPLGTILAKSDAFSFAFDLQISAMADTSPQIAVGLFNLTSAKSPGFSRLGVTTPNLFEFDYYADNGAGQPAIVATLADTNVGTANNRDIFFVFDNQPLNLGVTYHVVMTHAAGTTNLTAQVLANGQVYSTLPNPYPNSITDFRIDTFSVTSYGGGMSTTPAQGTVDNVVVTLPPPPVQNLTVIFTNHIWTAQFISRSNWLYTLQSSTNLIAWNSASLSTGGTGTNLFLTDANPPSDRAFYRIRADRP